jgi:xylulokinase
VLGLDLGTQSVKAVLLDHRGEVWARATAPCAVSFPRPGWAEQDPRDWERALEAAVRRLLAQAGTSRHEIVGIGIAAQVDGVVPVDRRLEPLSAAPIWLDRRATEQTLAFGQRLDQRTLREISGLNLDASHVAPKIAWLRRHGEGQRDAVLYLLPGSYLVARLTGVVAVDHVNASSTLLYDVRRRAWSEALLRAFDIDPRLLAPIRPCTQIAGVLSSKVAGRLGLTAGCPVVVGTGDEHAAAFAAGAVEPGVVCDIGGTAEPVGSAAAQPIMDPTGLLETHPHVLENRWFIENPGFVSGGSVLWLAETILDSRQEDMVDLAADAPPGSDGLLFVPALGGAVTPRWNDRVRGAFYGLTTAHGRAHLARALLEGCAFAVRDIVDRLDEVGLRSDSVRVVGGMARRPFLLQLKANVTGRRVASVSEQEATALGAAMIAATGIGWYPSLDDAAAAIGGRTAATYDPDLALRSLYDDAYRRYRSLFDAIEPLAQKEVQGEPAAP